MAVDPIRNSEAPEMPTLVGARPDQWESPPAVPPAPIEAASVTPIDQSPGLAVQEGPDPGPGLEHVLGRLDQIADRPAERKPTENDAAQELGQVAVEADVSPPPLDSSVAIHKSSRAGSFIDSVREMAPRVPGQAKAADIMPIFSKPPGAEAAAAPVKKIEVKTEDEKSGPASSQESDFPQTGWPIPERIRNQAQERIEARVVDLKHQRAERKEQEKAAAVEAKRQNREAERQRKQERRAEVDSQLTGRQNAHLERLLIRSGVDPDKAADFRVKFSRVMDEAMDKAVNAVAEAVGDGVKHTAKAGARTGRWAGGKAREAWINRREADDISEVDGDKLDDSLQSAWEAINQLDSTDPKVAEAKVKLIEAIKTAGAGDVVFGEKKPNLERGLSLPKSAESAIVSPESFSPEEEEIWKQKKVEWQELGMQLTKAKAGEFPSDWRGGGGGGSGGSGGGGTPTEPPAPGPTPPPPAPAPVPTAPEAPVSSESKESKEKKRKKLLKKALIVAALAGAAVGGAYLARYGVHINYRGFHLNWDGWAKIIKEYIPGTHGGGGATSTPGAGGGGNLLDHYTWDVAHAYQPGHETQLMSRAMDQYGNGAHFVHVHGTTEIALGNGHVVNHEEMRNLNEIVANLGSGG